MRTRALFAAAAAALTLLAACGSDSKSGAAGTTAGTETTGTGGSDTTTGATGSVNPEFADYCQKISDYKANANKFDEVFTSNTPDPAKTEEAFTSMKTLLQGLVDDAPADIAADVSTVNDATGQIIAIFDKYEWDVIKLSAAGDDATKFQEVLNDPKVNEASTRLDTWGQENCGFAPDA